MHLQCTSMIWETRLIIDSVTDKKITREVIDCNNNYYNYYTEIILYSCVCGPTSIHIGASRKNIVSRHSLLV